jgi:hypothetical protein
VSLSCDFGRDWMSNRAADLCRIAVAVGGFNASDLTRRLAALKPRGERLNAASVEKVLAAMFNADGPG